MLRAEFGLPSITDEEASPERKAPIRVKFEIPYFTVSGIQVRPLDITDVSFYHMHNESDQYLVSLKDKMLIFLYD